MTNEEIVSRMFRQSELQVTDNTLHGSAHASDNRLRRIVASAHSSSGHSLIEMLIVVALIGIVTSMALPQFIAQRRLTRSVGITREILTELREARQLAMSQRQAITFEYNDLTKQIRIINHRNNQPANPPCNLSRTAILVAPGFPDTACCVVVNSAPLAETAVNSEISYGIPAGLPAGALTDGIAMTPLFNSRFTVTFQPDGSVIDAAGDPQGRAMFIYNNRAASGTASAISIMGASGRVKIWRYNAGANLYAE